MAGKRVRIVMMSDTHEQHRRVDVPDGDLLIHAGDFTYFNRSSHAVQDFDDWLHALPHRHKVLVPGNHESCFGSPQWRDQITGAVVLVDSGIELAGLKIWGARVTPEGAGAIGNETDERCGAALSQIPKGTDVLITHGPPFGILDLARGIPQGSRKLLGALRHIKPRLHVFGHIHAGYGTARSRGTIFVNAALAGPGYSITKGPITVSFAPTDKIERRNRNEHNGP
jgi:Icc-related predicted phosphoesterase